MEIKISKYWSSFATTRRSGDLHGSCKYGVHDFLFQDFVSSPIKSFGFDAKGKGRDKCKVVDVGKLSTGSSSPKKKKINLKMIKEWGREEREKQ